MLANQSTKAMVDTMAGPMGCGGDEQWCEIGSVYPGNNEILDQAPAATQAAITLLGRNMALAGPYKNIAFIKLHVI